MTAIEWAEMVEDEPWKLENLTESQRAELACLLRIGAAAPEIAEALVESLAYYAYANREGKKVSAHFEEMTESTKMDAFRLSVMAEKLRRRDRDL